MSASLQAFIFDLDGTLIDSLADLATAVNRMLVEKGYPARNISLFPEFIGDGMKKLVERALPEEARDAAIIEACIKDYQRHYETCWHDQTRCYRGMAEAVVELKARGMQLGCISNKPDHFTRLCCDHFFPPGTFAVVFGQRDSVPRKPHPAAGLEAAKFLNLNPDEIAYVGDSGIDMAFAKASGMRAVGVSWGFRSIQELRHHGADVIVSDPAELIGLL